MSGHQTSWETALLVGVEKLIGLWTFWGRPRGSPRNRGKMLKIALFGYKIPKEFAGVSDLDFGAFGG